MRDFWKTVLAGAVGAVASLSVGLFGYWNTDRSHDIEMVRISLSILSGENQDTSLNGRKFALRALAKYADVEIPPDEFEEWARTGTIPDVGLKEARTFKSAIAIEDAVGLPFSGWAFQNMVVRSQTMQRIKQELERTDLTPDEREELENQLEEVRGSIGLLPIIEEQPGRIPP